MLLTNYSSEAILPFGLFGKTDEGVDKGSTRKTPGDSGDSKPPTKEDYRKIQRENDRETDPQEETVDNEERDKNRK
ncbi:hypothetical protein LV84_00763 [Algoriphagus ratkowskyi]|uniref:Uncharacterized protein n=1 Tax=Algoriphagus ratkowskyi TaxID=57028 RepID=A0A2W7RJB1_9BACT|nr:hypothetical protein [Algoriphagus ratkowskyi]PZX60484.1 hypothetical protein LV84_00763 [Algoriphagus ratkowskyi]TXD78288.1 hypothetical protein ESW18_09645 [Algoriphagus ratkowskyi]